MNERIKELRRQAIDHCLDRGSQGNLSEEVATKFAELIVRECMNVIYNIDDLGGYHFKAANAVKEHFGVAE